MANHFIDRFSDVSAIREYKGSLDWWWLGLYDNYQSFTHVWLDGSMYKFKKFKAGLPNDPLSNCVVFQNLSRTAIEWDQSGCTVTRNVACERSTGKCN